MSEERTVLDGDDAIALWKQGKVAWNAWVQETPDADVSFAGIDFSEHVGEGEEVAFTGYRFSRGSVSFVGSRFGEGDVSFSGATFDEGDVSFSGTTFGEGDVSFHGATFGEGSVFFSGATFGEGYVSFEGATFGEGDVSFRGATFGKGLVFFDGATFGEGSVFFSGATLGEGDVFFDGARFGEGYVSFRDTMFGEGTVSFGGARVHGAFTFSPLRGSEIGRLTFRYCRFDDILVLEGRFACIPDLRSTIVQGHVDLQNLHVAPWRSRVRSPWHRASRDPDRDAPALRRLKELAEANRHHDAALRFFADECRAQRWNHYGTAASLLDWAYDTLCNYGQSAGRPALGLIVSTLVFARLLFDLGRGVPKPGVWMFGEALSASLANTLPFIPSARAVRRDAFETLFGADPGFWIDALSIAQGAIAFVFLFLIGLGLRNRYRM